MSSEITEGDLQKFHDEHFNAKAVNLWNVAFAQNDRGGNSESANVEYTQSVERYPDGTIRTLTDEQILWFRESEKRELMWKKEKEQLLKEKELRQKALDKERMVSSKPETNPKTPISLKELKDIEIYQNQFHYSAYEILEEEEILDNIFRKFTALPIKYWPATPIRG